VNFLALARIKNFGRNVEFRPEEVLMPRTEEELLAAMLQRRGRRIRVVGRLHSWSEAPVADEVMIDLRHFDQVKVEKRDGKRWVTVGGGCQIKRLLAELDRQAAGTLPSLGLITEQTIAGAISTATHGSGPHSMSHYVEELRLATYDSESGEAVIRVIRGGPELQAARCSLGAMGVIVSVSFWSRPQYRIEKHFRQYATLEEVLAKEVEYPLQQFYLMPWRWDYVAQHRRETTAQKGGWAALYHWYFFLTFDVALHLVILMLVRVLRSSRAVRFFLRHLAPRLVFQNWRVVDRSQELLVMEHELFCHVEIEVFVKRTYIRDALEFVVALMKHFDGDDTAFDSATRDKLKSLELLQEIEDVRGSYTHHYPVCVRRVLPDDTLISMTAGLDEPSYAISFISYARPRERGDFFAFATILCKTLAALFDGRPHWGKICPLPSDEVARLYPRCAEFREICAAFDPNGAFRSRWLERLGLVEQTPVA
jgi:L-gulono-1,4-lactone dehydrogenase